MKQEKRKSIAEVPSPFKDRGTISPEQQEVILSEVWADTELIECVRKVFNEPHPVDEEGKPLSFNPTLKKAVEAFTTIVARISPDYDALDKSRLWSIFLCRAEGDLRND